MGVKNALSSKPNARRGEGTMSLSQKIQIKYFLATCVLFMYFWTIVFLSNAAILFIFRCLMAAYTHHVQ